MPEASSLEDRVPVEWKDERAVTCIPGRGPLDDAAADMLAQLLSKHGLGARILSNETVGRSTIASFDATGIELIVLCYVEITGTPAHLRYLVRRLRTQAPRARIMVGFWPADHPVFRDESIRSAVGAHHYVASLRDGVVRALQIATGEEQAPSAEASVVTFMPETRPVTGKRLRLPA